MLTECKFGVFESLYKNSKTSLRLYLEILKKKKSCKIRASLNSITVIIPEFFFLFSWILFLCVRALHTYFGLKMLKSVLIYKVSCTFLQVSIFDESTVSCD